MSTATEMLAKLSAAGLSADKSREVVKSEIDAGNVVADGDFIEKANEAIPQADVAAIDAAADAIAKAIELKTPAKAEESVSKEPIAKAESPYAEEGDAGAEDDEEDVEDGEEAVEASKKSSKSLNSDKDSDDYDIVAIVSKGADQILDSVESQNQTLAKGYMALKDTFANFADVLNKASSKIATLEGTVAELNKALGQPVAPRSVSGTVEPVPSPGETAIEKSAGQSQEAQPSQSLLAKAKAMLAEGGEQHRLYELALAVAELESGARPDDVAVRYSINVH